MCNRTQEDTTDLAVFCCLIMEERNLMDPNTHNAGVIQGQELQVACLLRNFCAMQLPVDFSITGDSLHSNGSLLSFNDGAT